ncbi:MAG: hypothetical protein AAFU38_10410 [Bacteroidota bacterium]
MLLFLDDYHLGDPLFLSGLAQDLARSQRPALLLHTGREAAATALEAVGVLDPESMLEGELGAHSAVVERSVRDENRSIAAALTEAGVAAVRLMASDRGLVQPGRARLVLGDSAWIGTLLRQRSCLVLAAMDARGAAPRLLDPATLAAQLGTTLGLPIVLLTTGRASGLVVDGEVAETVEIGTLATRQDVPARDLAAPMRDQGARVVVTSRAGAFDPRGARGTRLSA